MQNQRKTSPQCKEFENVNFRMCDIKEKNPEKKKVQILSYFLK